MFQRTAPWVVPHTNRRITGAERRLYRRVPALQRAIRAGVYAGRELLVLGFVKDPRLMGIPERLSRRHMHAQVSDPGLRDRITPDYTIGCKQILPSNNWYPALGEQNVELVTSPDPRGARGLDLALPAAHAPLRPGPAHAAGGRSGAIGGPGVSAGARQLRALKGAGSPAAAPPSCT